ncbi:MAG: glutamate synthase subunit beta [Acidimicrobiales bacterium]
MADPRGFLRFGRLGPDRRPVHLRLKDWREIYEPFGPQQLIEQAARCMDCGIPFCHEGCPLGNLIPEWNDLVYRSRPGDAAARLEATNNFPEFTGRLCPAPCEGSCVLGINDEPVSIKQVELEIANWATQRLEPRTARSVTSKRVAIVGSGPAGLAAAQQLTRAGHGVVVFERAERPGGLLRYGIPEFKMGKAVLDRRIAQMRAEGTEFQTHTSVGVAAVSGADESKEVLGTAALDAAALSAADLVREFDAVVLACGATRPRDLLVPGRSLDGVHFAMEYLKPCNQVCEGSLEASSITATGKHVVIIGGGDTGADCLGTVHRQGAASVHQLEILPAPPLARAADNPWPTWPVILRTAAAHEEGGERVFAVTAVELLGDIDTSKAETAHGTGRRGHVQALRLKRVSQQVVDGRAQLLPVEGTEFEMAADLVLLAMGFSGPERNGVVAELGLRLDERGNVAVGPKFMTNAAAVFACGDMARGQSLIVWAIAEGRSVAAAVDRYLMGTSALPQPIVPGQLALR